MTDEILDIQKKVKEEIDEKRYIHTLGVANVAACLAMRYGFDVDRAYLTGLLHDCAKGYSDDDYLKICKENDISISESEKLNPSLLHAKLGAHFAGQRYNVYDEEILSAIRCHTTGKPGMSLLDKIIYIADYIEPSRRLRIHMEEIRRAAFSDIDPCLLMILGDTVEYLKSSGKIIDTATQETYDYYKNTRKV